MEPWIVWGILALVFGIIEASTINLISIWFMVSALVTMLCSLADISVTAQIVLFAIVTIILLVATRPLIKKFNSSKSEPLNADRCIGKTAVVIEAIDNIQSTGQVKVDGQIWSAVSASGEPIEQGKYVTIERIEGVKLYVSNK
jgi:membrane protein implicated in regulation of membrane protease activity